LKKMSKAAGVLVANVLPGSPAQQAGIEPGDSITDYNGVPVPESRAQEDIPVFNRMVLTTPLGTRITLKGMHARKPVTWQLPTTEGEPNEAREAALSNWGLTVRNFTRVSALENQRKDKSGAQVDSVRQGWPAAEAKPPLRADDIITKVAGQPVAGVE